MRKNEKYFLCFFIIILIFQSGCTEAHIVDTQRMIHVGGFDITKTKNFAEQFYIRITQKAYNLNQKLNPLMQVQLKQSLPF